jgi:hypothetical protein
MMLLEGKSQHSIDNTNYFQRHHWDGYLSTCRALREELHVRLRDLDRAFWASAGQVSPTSWLAREAWPGIVRPDIIQA